MEHDDGWTLRTFAIHTEALRKAEEKFLTERDRRYAEVGTEREKALKIKETADKEALRLAREIQVYKDEKANQLREQIHSERGFYASKSDVIAASEKLEETIKPISTFVDNQAGKSAGMGLSANVVVTIITVLIAISGLILSAYLMTH